MRVGGYNKQVDLSKLRGVVLIGACVILAVRTARWPVTVHKRTSQTTISAGGRLLDSAGSAGDERTHWQTPAPVRAEVAAGR